MPIEIILPKVDMDMSHARLVQWYKAPGERVGQGEVLFEIETDKSTMEIEASAGGILGCVSGEPGSDIEIGCTIGWLFQEGEDSSVEPGVNPGVDPGTGASPGSVDGRGAVRATPLARANAREHGVELARIDGSGPGGRIVAADVSGADVSFRNDIAFRQWGDPADPLCLLLHGFAGDSTTWSALASQLARRGRHVIAPDLPGHGLTRIDALVPDALGDGLAAFIAELPGKGGCHLIAHSMGALPALQLAASMNVATLSLLAPIGMGERIDREFLAGMAEPASRAGMLHQLRKLGARASLLSEPALDALYGVLSQGRLRALAEALASRTGQSVDIVTALNDVAGRLPCRVLVGHLDRIVDWRDACGLGARVPVHHLRLAGHMPHWDAPVEVCDLLLAGGTWQRASVPRDR